MNLTGHLLYIDITQICGIGCSFCMYSDKHERGASMSLSERSCANLAALINEPTVKRISVSGEGEPLNNIKTFHDIIGLSLGGKSFEFITSGFLPHDKLMAFYRETNALLLAKGNTCNIRLSSDSYHIAKVRHKAHGFSVQYWLDEKPAALSFSFRSVDTDRAFTRAYLLAELSERDIQAEVYAGGILDDKLVVGSASFDIEYKNHVHPEMLQSGEYLDIIGYIQAIEARYQKPFTLGSMNRAPMENGMDVTVKPDGSVHFYGVENVCLDNIHTGQLSWASLKKKLLSDALISKLYTTPFVELIGKIAGDPIARRAITRANNPYWVIKELARTDGILQKMVQP